MERVIIQWTETAKNGLARLPKKVRRGLLDKASALRECTDPAKVHKPLQGPLQGYFRICYSRYRAIYSVSREDLPNGDVLQTVIVRFIAVGIRNEGDKNDIYRLAQRLIQMGVIPAEEESKEQDLEFQDDES